MTFRFLHPRRIKSRRHQQPRERGSNQRSVTHPAGDVVDHEMVESRVERLLVSDDALRAVAVGLIALGIDERPAADEQRQVKQRLRLHRGAVGWSVGQVQLKLMAKKIGFHYKNWFSSALLGMRFVVGRSVVRCVGGWLCNDDDSIFNYTMDIQTLALTHAHDYLLLFPCFFFLLFFLSLMPSLVAHFYGFLASHIFTKRDNLLITLLARPSPPFSRHSEPFRFLCLLLFELEASGTLFSFCCSLRR